MGNPALCPGCLGFSGRCHCPPFLCADMQTLRVVFAVLGKGCFGIILNCMIIYKPELLPTSLR